MIKHEGKITFGKKQNFDTEEYNSANAHINAGERIRSSVSPLYGNPNEMPSQVIDPQAPFQPANNAGNVGITNPEYTTGSVDLKTSQSISPQEDPSDNARMAAYKMAQKVRGENTNMNDLEQVNRA